MCFEGIREMRHTCSCGGARGGLKPRCDCGGSSASTARLDSGYHVDSRREQAAAALADQGLVMSSVIRDLTRLVDQSRLDVLGDVLPWCFITTSCCCCDRVDGYVVNAHIRYGRDCLTERDLLVVSEGRDSEP
jgi:hypothetical protein